MSYQDLCEAALFYTQLLRKKVDTQPRASGEAVSEPVSGLAGRWMGVGGGWGPHMTTGTLTSPHPHPTHSGASLQLCVVLNNVELLRRAVGQALRGLAWSEGASGLTGGLPRSLLNCTQALDEDLQREACTVTAHLTSKVGKEGGMGTGSPSTPTPLRAEHCSPSDGG